MIPETLVSGARPLGAFALTPQPLTIRAIHTENYRTKTFVFDGALPHAAPGQFVMAWLPRLDEKPFSLAYAEPLTLTVAAVGRFSTAMHALAVGDKVWFRGAFGQPFRMMGNRPALVGGGYGVAPMAWLAEWVKMQGGDPIGFIGGRNEADIIGVSKFEAQSVPVYVTTNDGSYGEEGLVTAPVERLLEQGTIDSICAVGPHGMLHALEILGQRYGVPTQLSWEAYMGCAIGICGMCEHSNGSLLCVEGPVRLVE
jgi:dihydroorotate dehydrogenase electron transfer subunit